MFFPDGSSVYASAEVPQEALALLLEHQKYIYQLEVMALCGTYFSLPIERFASCDILHFADNTAANITSIKGYAKVEDAALMVSAYNIQIARAAARIRIEYVPSKKNIADLPSRPLEPEWQSAVASFASSKIPFVFPSLSSWGSW